MIQSTTVGLRWDFPNFLVVGASKSGTSSLYHYLKQHPEIGLSSVKETQFFNCDEIFGLGVDRFVDLYFDCSSSCKAIGDITPSYLVRGEKVLPRILSVYGDKPPKIVVIMREPVSRAWSHYLHKVRSGEENLSFEDAIAREEERIEADPGGWWGYRNEGNYEHFIQKWLQVIPRKNFLFITTEELADDPENVLSRLYRHVGVDPFFRAPDMSRKNVGGQIRSRWLLGMIARQGVTKRIIKSIFPYRMRQKMKSRLIAYNTKTTTPEIEMTTEVRKQLAEFYIESNSRLAQTIGRELDEWRQPDESEVR
ncbi:sulfotransferase family protein [Haliea sp. E17]|uniref:sulfotransferase family protein n=1 Tax=Haliea sp. E17 TaxID=3401576 RepID=UPI003AAA9772